MLLCFACPPPHLSSIPNTIPFHFYAHHYFLPLTRFSTQKRKLFMFMTPLFSLTQTLHPRYHSTYILYKYSTAHQFLLRVAMNTTIYYSLVFTERSNSWASGACQPSLRLRSHSTILVRLLNVVCLCINPMFDGYTHRCCPDTGSIHTRTGKSYTTCSRPANANETSQLLARSLRIPLIWELNRIDVILS